MDIVKSEVEILKWFCVLYRGREFDSLGASCVFRIRQAVVVRLLADVFGISQETPMWEERLVVEPIKT